jgi:hypothetical protein
VSEPNDGGAAFPTLVELGFGEFRREIAPGMSLRDYFAAKAMQTLIAANVSGGPDLTAGAAYDYADAMLAGRSKP